ncbi:MAG: hypothetical protein LKF94_10595 [Kerstersia gyiorum]|jgi:hypothetical protein|nr:hypothetical protein [Kerstersia gyiorum]MCH4271920.1 hypothetical protein [Kerstersia gyiorum]MCI1229454.1 hypothetical protein [Kerstersia gyiorum]
MQGAALDIQHRIAVADAGNRGPGSRLGNRRIQGLAAAALRDLDVTALGLLATHHRMRAFVEVVVAGQHQVDLIAQQHLFFQRHKREIGRAAVFGVGPERIVLHQHDEVELAILAALVGVGQVFFHAIEFFHQFLGGGQVAQQRTARAEQEVDTVHVPGEVSAFAGLAETGTVALATAVLGFVIAGTGHHGQPGGIGLQHVEIAVPDWLVAIWSPLA